MRAKAQEPEGVNMSKPKYTREEKIAYYKALKIKAEQRLQYLESPDYQEWDGGLAKELRQKQREEEMIRLVDVILSKKAKGEAV